MDNENIKKTEEANPPLDPDSLAEPEAPDEIVTETDTSVAEEGAEEKKSVIRKFFPKKEKQVLSPEEKKARLKKRALLALELFLCYLKIGLFTFGGGYAMIALIEREYVRKKKWITDEEFYEIIAISESTPGPIAINSATFIGYKLVGFWGAFVAVVAVCIPSFVRIYIISIFYDAFMAFTPAQYEFQGINVGIAILITSAGVGMMKKAKKDAFDYIIFVPAFLLVTLFDIFNIDFSSVYLILIGIAIGIIYKVVLDAIAGKKGVAIPGAPDVSDGAEDGGKSGEERK